MARLTKQGVDYFPLDVHMDDKMKFIEIKYKLEGFAIVIKLLQKIYAEGYWCKWGEDESLLFSDESRADIGIVNKVVAECLSRGVFDKKLYDKYQILTSKGIQKRFKEIVRRRKEVDVITEYILIDSIFEVNDSNKGINVVIMDTPGKHDDGKSTQSKVKESKVKESKGKEKKVKKSKVNNTSLSPQVEKSKSKNLLFSESEFINKDNFTAAFIGTDYEYADLNYYFEAVKNWSASGAHKKIDWIATARGFMLRDSKENKLKLRNGTEQHTSETAAFGKTVDDYLARKYGG